MRPGDAIVLSAGAWDALHLQEQSPAMVTSDIAAVLNELSSEGVAVVFASSPAPVPHRMPTEEKRARLTPPVITAINQAMQTQLGSNVILLDLNTVRYRLPSS